MYQWINEQLDLLNEYKRDKSELEIMYIKKRLDNLLNSYINSVNLTIDCEKIKNNIELDLYKIRK